MFINIKKKVEGQDSAKKLKTFVSSVKSYGEYDLKRQQEWQETISYNGIVMEPQDIGNFHFGYMERAIGYDVNFLTLGAGAYQLYEHPGELITYRNCFTMFACDNPRDSFYIRLGAIVYNQEH